MSTTDATTADDLGAYIPKPAAQEGRQMVGITTADHARIAKLAKKYKTSNGRVVKALLDFYYDE